MFNAIYENEETAQVITAWIPSAVIERKARQTVCMAKLKSQQLAAVVVGGAVSKEEKRRIKEAERALSAANKEYDHARKVEQIFNEMADKAGFIKIGA